MIDTPSTAVGASERYPGYNVLSKRDSPSWNAQTRTVVDQRLSLDPGKHRFLTDGEWATLRALCACIVPQHDDPLRKVPVAAMLDQKLAADARDGYRDHRLPPLREAWRRGLRALDAEALARHRVHFGEIAPELRSELLQLVQRGEAHDPAWGEMPPAIFFSKRVVHDIVAAYYAHPTAWSEIGFGGPASPRGYVRMSFDRRDPWEAAEARAGDEEKARRKNAHVR